MQGPKNMFEMLVSRFLYVLCWRNKVVIILIILSASVAMLMMLSYHGNKQPGSVDEVLKNGKSRVVMKNELGSENNPGILRSSRFGLARQKDSKTLSTQNNMPEKVPNPNQLMNGHNEKSVLNRGHKFELFGKVRPEKAGAVQASASSRLGGNKVNAEHLQSINKVVDTSTGDERGAVKKSKQEALHLNGIQSSTHGIRATFPKQGLVLKVPPDTSLYNNNNNHQTGENKREKRIFSDEIRFEKGKYLHRKKTPNVNNDNGIKPLNIQSTDGNHRIIMNMDKSERLPIGQRKNTGGIGKDVNQTPSIDRFKEQEMKLAKLRKKNKIDALLKVLNRHSTTRAPNVLSEKGGKSKQMAAETAPGSKRGNEEGPAKGGGDKSSQHDKIDVDKLAWNSKTLNNNNQPVWHRDHYHRDENVVVMQDKVMKNGSPQFVLRQSSAKNDVKPGPLDSAVGADTNTFHSKVVVNGQATQPNISLTTQRLAPKPTTRPTTRPTLSPNKKFLAANISNLFAIAHQHSLTTFKPKHSPFSYRKNGFWPNRMAEWQESEEKFCDGSFWAYNNEFAFVKDVIVDRNFCHGRKGGELITDVINQPEEEEYYTYFPGFFQLPCSTQPQYFFNNNNHLNQWLYSVSNAHDGDLYSELHTEFTILVVRYEYANLYHTMTDWYNAFLLMEFFNNTQTKTNILIVDGHPAGALDGVWSVLFNSSRRISAQKMRTKYLQVAWNTLGYNSLMMDHYAPNIPLVEEFRTFFLSSFRIPDLRNLDCDKINILFIWRRDYIAHPRNPSGSISRKIQNEEELVITLRQNFPTFTVKGIQIDLFEMDQQLKFVTDTDILIGMHGAGLTHAMFLPKHAGMIELVPTYWSAANEHFHAIARWRHIHYRQWTNTNPDNEAPNHYTKIPPEVLNAMVVDMVKVVCGLATDPPDAFAV